MNRIYRLLYRTSPFAPTPTMPTECGYCNRPLAGSKFNGMTPYPPYVGACITCIQRLERMSRLSELNAIAPDWVRIHSAMSKRLMCEPGTRWAKQEVVGLIRKLAQRSASLLNGELDMGLKSCGLSVLPLSAPRIALLGANADYLFRLVAAAAEVLGMATVEAGDDYDAALKNLLALIGGDQRYLDHSIVFSNYQKHLQRTDSCPIIFAGQYKPSPRVDLVVNIPVKETP